MEMDNIQTIKVALILCSCFFGYGSFWSDWAFDYYLLWTDPNEHPEAIARATFYYANQAHIPNILRYVPIVILLIATVGLSTGLFTLINGNLLYDGASLVLLFFGLSTYFTSIKPAIGTITQSRNIENITVALKNIAAAHFIIVLSITGIIGLQVTHYFVIKRSSKSNDEEEEEDNFDEEDDDEEEEEKGSLKGKQF